jgi:hypothetical protein
MSFIAGASCVMCGRGVHENRGRVACDGCDLPTDSCLCDRVEPPPPPEQREPRRRRARRSSRGSTSP